MIKKTFYCLSSLSFLALMSEECASFKVNDVKKENFITLFDATNQVVDMWDLGQWFARTNFNYEWNSHISNLWWIQTVQPLYITKKTERHTLFAQAQFMGHDKTNTWNAGAGWRFLTSNYFWIFGLNLFYDIMTHNYQNLSLGGDIQTPWVSLFANYYQNIGNWHTLFQNDAFTERRRSLSGIDVGLSFPVIYLPWIRLKTTYYHWETFKEPSINGFELRAQAFLWGPITLEGGADWDNKATNGFILFRLNFGTPNWIQFTLTKDRISKQPFPMQNMKKFVLWPVSRQNIVQVETKISSPST